MLKSIKFDFLKIVKNRRFLIFSVLFPLLWFIAIIMFSPQEIRGMQSYILNIAVLCILFSTIGSYINTLSSRVSREKEYAILIFKTTPFGPLKYIFSSGIVQLILSFFIALIIILFGAIVFGLIITKNVLLMCFIVLYSGIFYILIGFCIGFTFEAGTLQSFSFPLFIIVTFLSIPLENFSFFPNMLIAFQKITPFYYVGDLIYSIACGKSILECINDLVIITITIFVMTIITIFVLRHQQMNENRI